MTNMTENTNDVTIPVWRDPLAFRGNPLDNSRDHGNRFNDISDDLVKAAVINVIGEYQPPSYRCVK